MILLKAIKTLREHPILLLSIVSFSMLQQCNLVHISVKPFEKQIWVSIYGHFYRLTIV